MTKVRFWVLDVGQGSGNFVEIFENDTDTVPSGTIVLDLGSEGARKAAADPSALWLVERLKTMPQPTIDAFYLSHGDGDHRNKVRALLDKFTPYVPGTPSQSTLLIRRVMYGGEYGEYAYTEKSVKRNVIDDIKKYMTGKDEDLDFSSPDMVENKESSFTPGGVGPHDSVADVQIYMVVGNVVTTDVFPAVNTIRDGYPKNTDSLVILVFVNGTGFVVTGDATGKTMYECNSLITNAIKMEYFNAVFMVTAPHHGSRSTGLDVRGIDVGAEANMTAFAKNLDPGCFVVSAWQNQKYKHPSIQVIRIFLPYLDPAAHYEEPNLGGLHYFTSFFEQNTMKTDLPGDSVRKWPSTDGYRTMFTAANLYTTSYYPGGVVKPENLTLASDGSNVLTAGPGLPAVKPPTGVAWVFQVDSQANLLVEPMTNRQLLDLALRNRLAMPRPPAVAAPSASAGMRRLRVIP